MSCNLYKYLVFFAIGVFTLLPFGSNCKNKTKDINPENKIQLKNGPAWVKESLSENNVFETPVFQFTCEYDQYRQYSNIRGLFFNGLPYHEKSTKVFCWYAVPETLQNS